MNTALKQRRVVDTILTKVVMGYALDQEFSGHHLFPDVEVTAMGGKILKFGKDAHIVRDTKRAPGETVRSIDFAYSADDYALTNRLLEGKVPEEFVEAMKKPGISAQTEAVNIVMSSMRLEGEADKAKLATTAGNYATGHSQALSGTDVWDNPSANPLAVIADAKATIRKATGRYPNVLHLDIYAFEGLKRNEKILAAFKHQPSPSITTDMLASYFDIAKVVVAKAVFTADVDSEFSEIWGNNTVLAYVAPKGQQGMRRPSFGYNYLLKGLPKAEKGYFENSDRSWHYPVKMADSAVITAPAAGFLIQNTATIK